MKFQDEDLRLFAVTAPGLEELCASELRSLGMRPTAEAGGASWEGGLEELYRANLCSRLATRVLVRMAEFRARTFFELERHAAKVEWGAFIDPDSAVHLRVSCRKSRLYHEGAVAQRIRLAMERSVGGIRDAGDPDGDAGGAGEPPRLFVVRFLHDRCIISADSSGEPLHRRGYRQELARAPMRETLAATLLAASGWDLRSPLVDPMCGSGTIPIEAALLARRIAPGLANRDLLPRQYAFRRWRGYQETLWNAVVDRARAAALPATPGPILAADRDAGAVRAAAANAERAGVLADVEILHQAVSATEPIGDSPGWLVSNPPYGVRVGESAPLRNLYAAVGRTARERLAGWTVALLSVDSALEAQLGLPLAERLQTRNGGIPVRVLVGRVPA